MNKRKNVICVDFDGVLSTYTGWKGFDVLGEPIQKTINVVKKLYSEGWYIVIYTTRPYTQAMEDWLKQNEVPYDDVNRNSHNPPMTSVKPIADVFMDDRAINPVKLTEEELYMKAIEMGNEATKTRDLNMQPGGIDDIKEED